MTKSPFIHYPFHGTPLLKYDAREFMQLNTNLRESVQLDHHFPYMEISTLLLPFLLGIN